MFAAAQPAPAATVQHPDRLAERAGEMRDRGVDSDHRVQRLDERGVGKVLELVSSVDQRYAVGRVLPLGGGLPFCSDTEVTPPTAASSAICCRGDTLLVRSSPLGISCKI